MRIDPNSHVPVYRQIADDIRAAIAANVYRPGERLPSLRVLALELVVNPNTVQHAYERLEREGLVCSRKGLGLFVARRGGEAARSKAEASVHAMFAQAISAARAADLAPDRIEGLFRSALSKARKGVDSRS